jgi:hypothetical protein
MYGTGTMYTEYRFNYVGLEKNVSLMAQSL